MTAIKDCDQLVRAYIEEHYSSATFDEDGDLEDIIEFDYTDLIDVAHRARELGAREATAQKADALRTDFSQIKNPYDGSPEAHVFEQGVLACFAELRGIMALDPARTKAMDDLIAGDADLTIIR